MFPNMPGQVPLGYPMMMGVPIQQPVYPMAMPPMMMQQVRPPMGVYPQPNFPQGGQQQLQQQVPNPQNFLAEQLNNMHIGHRPYTQGGNIQNKQ